MSDFEHHEMFPLSGDEPEYRLISSDYVSTIDVDGQEILKIDGQALTLLCATAMRDISHLLRTDHLEQLASILDDPEASDNDRFVAID